MIAVAIAVAVVLLAILAVAATYSVTRWPLHKEEGGGGTSLREKLKAAVARGDSRFDFAASDPAFAWDRMFVFGPYSSQRAVDDALGFHWEDFSKTDIESSEGISLVVFVRQGAVVSWFEQSGAIELPDKNNMESFARSEAAFDIIRKESDPSRVWLRRN